jgi:hypothetical protein
VGAALRVRLTVLAVDMAVATVLLMVASPINPPCRPDLHHVLSVSYASSMDILPRSVGIAMRKILLISAMPLLLLHPEESQWYTDSVATYHITGDLDRLTMHEPYHSNNQIHVANGSGMSITCIGNSIIPTSSRNLVLNNVLHIPSTHKNLISIHHFTLDNDTLIEFHPYIFLIKDQNTTKVLLHGQCKGGLYPLPPSTFKFRKLVFSAIKLSVDRWHCRLGHPSLDIVRRVVLKNKLPCVEFDSSSESVCDACACAKAHQLPYPVSTSHSSAHLKLIYSDVWVRLLIPLTERNIMLILLMIITNSHESICSIINMRFPNTF